MINAEVMPTMAVLVGLAKELIATRPPSRSWPLKSNRDRSLYGKNLIRTGRH
jgi:hypothetical protein